MSSGEIVQWKFFFFVQFLLVFFKVGVSSVSLRVSLHVQLAKLVMGRAEWVSGVVRGLTESLSFLWGCSTACRHVSNPSASTERLKLFRGGQGAEEGAVGRGECHLGGIFILSVVKFIFFFFFYCFHHLEKGVAL